LQIGVFTINYVYNELAVENQKIVRIKQEEHINTNNNSNSSNIVNIKSSPFAIVDRIHTLLFFWNPKYNNYSELGLFLRPDVFLNAIYKSS